MSKNRPGTKGFLKRFQGKVYVGAEDLSDPASPYRGPLAEVTADDTWLRVVADPYDNHLMLNIEAVPYLRKALAEIERKQKAAKCGVVD